MAIDTAVKRNSVLAIATNLLPLPDNTIDQGDRQTLLRHYAGILAGAAVEVVSSIYGSVVRPIWRPVAKNIIDEF